MIKLFLLLSLFAINMCSMDQESCPTPEIMSSDEEGELTDYGTSDYGTSEATTPKDQFSTVDPSSSTAMPTINMCVIYTFGKHDQPSLESLSQPSKSSRQQNLPGQPEETLCRICNKWIKGIPGYISDYDFEYDDNKKRYKKRKNNQHDVSKHTKDLRKNFR